MAGPPLLFVHGMWCAPGVWDWFAERYRAAGHEVAVPAVPYHDADPAAPPVAALGTTGVRDYVDALVEAAAALPEKPVIIGHSMGGLLAQLLAERTGARGLVLLAPAPSATTQHPAATPIRAMSRMYLTWRWWQRPVKLDEKRARWGVFNGVPPDVAAEQYADFVWESGRALFEISLPGADKSRATVVDYGRLSMPALVITGDQDRLIVPGVSRKTAAALPGRTVLHEIRGAGHWLFHSPVRDEVAAEVDGFLAALGD